MPFTMYIYSFIDSNSAIAVVLLRQDLKMKSWIVVILCVTITSGLNLRGVLDKLQGTSLKKVLARVLLFTFISILFI